MKRPIFAFVFAACVSASFALAGEPTFRRAETFEDVHAASCRVRVDGAAGSGTFVGEADGKCWILTNYHVVEKNATARLDFWTNGTLETVDANVVWRAYDAKRGFDFAFCVVDPARLAAISPPYVRLGGPNDAPGKNAFIVSSGCPDGRFAQAWKGRVVGDWENSTALFQPPPVPGQSGSGVLEYRDGEPILVAVLTWLIGERGRDDSQGGAIPIKNLYAAASPGTPAAAPTASPVPPGAVECGRRRATAGDAFGLRSVPSLPLVACVSPRSDGSAFLGRRPATVALPPTPVDAPAATDVVLAPTVVPELASDVGDFDQSAAFDEMSRRAILLFRRAGCPACDAIAADVARLEREGVAFEIVETDRGNGANAARAFGVRFVPQAFLVRVDDPATKRLTVLESIPADASFFASVWARWTSERRKIVADCAPKSSAADPPVRGVDATRDVAVPGDAASEKPELPLDSLVPNAAFKTFLDEEPGAAPSEPKDDVDELAESGEPAPVYSSADPSERDETLEDPNASPGAARSRSRSNADPSERDETQATDGSDETLEDPNASPGAARSRSEEDFRNRPAVREIVAGLGILDGARDLSRRDDEPESNSPDSRERDDSGARGLAGKIVEAVESAVDRKIAETLPGLKARATRWAWTLAWAFVAAGIVAIYFVRVLDAIVARVVRAFRVRAEWAAENRRRYRAFLDRSSAETPTGKGGAE